MNRWTVAITLAALVACGGEAPHEDAGSDRAKDEAPDLGAASVQEIIALPDTPRLPSPSSDAPAVGFDDVIVERVQRTAGGWVTAIRISKDARILRGEGPLSGLRWEVLGELDANQRRDLEELRDAPVLDDLPKFGGMSPDQATPQTPRNVWSVRRSDDTVKQFKLYGYPGPRYPILERIAAQALPNAKALGFVPRSALTSPGTSSWVALPCRAGQIVDLRPLVLALQDTSHDTIARTPDDPVFVLHDIDPAGGQSWTLHRGGEVVHVDLKGQAITRALDEEALSIAKTLLEQVNFGRLADACPP